MNNNDKIKILFVNFDTAGVNYFRTQTPATQLERDHSDKFRVEFNSELDFNNPKTIDYLKSFHIIHYHRQLVGGTPNMLRLANELKEANVTLVMDIDDYWYLDKSHPYYSISQERRLWEEILDNLKIADYVTTTSDYFAEEIRKVTGKDNVVVLPNSVDPTWMKQFKNNWKPDPDGLVRITYMAGSSHKGDVEQLKGAIARLNNDKQTKGKFKIQLAGWDTEGNTTDITFNQEFRKVLQRIGIWDKDMVNAVNKSRGNVDVLTRVPNDVKEAFRNKVFTTKERPIDSEQSIYLVYENILTDNHSIIEDDEYIKWLNNYERNTYPNEGNFARRWTRKANIYAEVLNETDIAIAPLADHEFNHMKCVVGDTLINTNKGIIKIKDLVENKYDDLKILNNDVISYFKYDNEKTLKLKTNIGVELEGTPTHRIFVDDKWKPMSEFGVGDKIELTSFDFESTEYQKIHYPMLLSKRVDDITLECATKEMMPSITINEDYGRFFGYMIGDGHFSTNYLRISCDKRYDDVVKDIVKLSNKMGLHPKLIYDKIDKRCKTTISKEGYGVDINLTSKHLASICIQENLKNENGKVFEIPHFILKSPKSVIKEFLRGLFEADGTVSTDGSFVSLTSKSLILMKQVQTLLLGFDIIGKIDVAPNKRYKKNYYNLRLTRAASDMFYKEIGFVSEIKQEKLKLLTEKPHSNRFQEQNFEIIVTDIIENTNDVYDVEVDNIHKYNGNGIINHNSNLKQVECWSRKLPVVCTDVIPYNVDGRHMENCVLIPTSNSKGDKRKEKNLDKYWYKYLKQLILNPVLRKELGENLHRDFSEKYNLKNVTNKRAEFYESVVMEQLNIV